AFVPGAGPAGGPVVPGTRPGDIPPPDPLFGAPRQGNFGPPNGPPKELLLPDPLPGGPSSRSAYPAPATNGVLGPPAKSSAAQTPEPPVAGRANPTAAALPGFTRVKDGV